jgi:hypothetical protein
MSRKSHKLFLAAPQYLGHSSYVLDYTIYKLTIDIEEPYRLQELRSEDKLIYWQAPKIKGNVVILKVFNEYVLKLKQILKFFLVPLGATGYKIQQLPPDQGVPKRARKQQRSNYDTNLKKK